MTYRLSAETPTLEIYLKTRAAAGLSRKSEQAARIGLSNSLYAVVVYHDTRAIGIGRVIGDGGCFFEVTDMAVVPEHQGKGVGRLIMQALVDWLHDNAPETAFVSLMAFHGKPEFYKKFGFAYTEQPDAAGMYLRIT